MDLTLVEQLACREMAAAGLEGWEFAWDRAKRRAGVCRFGNRTISLSRPLMELFAHEEVLDTIRHEIAHALVGPEHKHDAVWRAAARRLGATPKARMPASLPTPPPTWVGECPRGHQFRRYRRPSAKVSCSACHPTFDARFVVEWERAAA
nr:sprT domain-containing protein [Actinomycetales bacterium]